MVASSNLVRPAYSQGEKMKKTLVTKHQLIPNHTKLNDKEKQSLLEKYGITLKDLPSLHSTDPGIADLKAKPGDIIKIERSSPTAGQALFYRSVIE